MLRPFEHKTPPRGSPVWDGEASVHGALERAEHLVSGGGAGEAGVQVAGEGAWLAVHTLHVELVAGHLHLALVHLVQAELAEQLEEEEEERHAHT